MARGLTSLTLPKSGSPTCESERFLPRRSRCPILPRSLPGRLLACFLVVRSLISTVHVFSGSARICSAILWVTALSSVSCASHPKIPVAADLAGKPMITTVDSNLAKYNRPRNNGRKSEPRSHRPVVAFFRRLLHPVFHQPPALPRPPPGLDARPVYPTRLLHRRRPST